MRFLLTAALLLGLCATSNIAQAGEESITDDQVKKMVTDTVTAMKKDAPGVIEKIKKSEHPFVNKDDKALYAFIYDMEVNMVAHPKAELVGQNFKDKPDVKGKKFRAAIVEGAKAKGSGWEDYMYQKPGESGMFEKKAYFEKVKASDGKEYVVVSGNYKKPGK
jgi:polar amino acid transport system substrate-binding protein